MTELSKTVVSKLTVNTFFDAKNRSSFCWKYFGRLVVVDGKKKKIVNPDLIYCLACLNAVQNESEDITFGSVKIKSYNKTVSTGNLTRHLRDDHRIKIEYVRAVKAKTEVKDTVTRPSKASSAIPQVQNTSSSTTHDKWQLARDLALWFCKSLLPFDSLCDEGMVDFFKKYNLIVTENDLPSRHLISGTALSGLYESMLTKVKGNISIDAATHSAITFDLWADQYRRLNYVTFTLHYLTSEFNLKTLTLRTYVLTEKNTEERIKDAFEDVKKKFELEDKNIVVVSDSGGNVKAAVSVDNTSHHLCLGHGLHKLVVIDGISSIPEIVALTQKIKIIVKTIRYRAPEFHADVEKIQQQLEFLSSLERVVEAIECDEGDPIPEDDLTIQESNEFEDSFMASAHSSHIPAVERATPTRWHCILEMLESLMHACYKEPVNEMLRKIGRGELEIAEIEWILVEDLVKFLNSFREAVQIMSSQKTCTINVALVFRSEIIDVLNTLQDDESQIMLRLKRNMLANINKRFPVSKLIVAAALLDCRFMSLREVNVFLEKQNMTRTSFLSSYVREVIGVNNIPEITSANCESETSLLHKLSKKHSACQGIQDDPIEQECWRYIAAADPTEPKDGDLLSYWDHRKETFPFLSALARAILCVPATSTPSERVFSVAGLKVTAKRSRLSASRVDKIIFIHDNHKTCEPDVASIKTEY